MAIYYTSSSASGGGAGSYADPWTLQEAFDSAVAGDEVRILNDGTYTPSARIDIDTNKGTSGSRIKFLGRNSADTAYEKATISASSLSSAQHLIYFGFNSAPNGAYLQFENLIFDGSYPNTNQFGTQNQFYNWYCTFIRCVFKNSNSTTLSSGYYFNFYECEFLDGASYASSTLLHTKYRNCLFKNIDSHYRAENRTDFVGCVFINVGATFYFSGNFFSCTFDGAGSQASAWTAGLDDSNSIVNCVFINYTGTVITGFTDHSFSCSGNYFYNNGTNASFVLNETNITTGGDPLFVSTVSGSENYTPQSSSPLIGAGVPGTIPYSAYQDMVGYATPGAIVPQAGGGLLRVNLNGGI